MQEKSEENAKGAIRSKVFVRNFFVGRANFFNYELKYSSFTGNRDNSKGNSTKTCKTFENNENSLANAMKFKGNQQKTEENGRNLKRNLLNFSCFPRKSAKTPYFLGNFAKKTLKIHETPTKPREIPLEEILAILEKSPENRHENELNLLRNSAKKLLMHAKSPEIPEEIAIKHCSRVLFPDFRQENTGFSPETGDFFVILAGSIKFSSKSRAIASENTLFPGDCFGKPDFFRENTVICKENCHFAVLKAADLLKIEENQAFEQLKFLHSVNLLEKVPISLLKSMISQSSAEFFQRNSLVFKENEPARDFFVVKTGVFKLSKAISLEKPKNSPFFELFQGKTRENREKREFPVCLLGKGECFGFSELLSQRNREFSAICESERGILYKFSRQEFFKKIANDERNVRRIREICEKSAEIHRKRLEEFMVFSRFPDKNSENQENSCEAMPENRRNSHFSLKNSQKRNTLASIFPVNRENRAKVKQIQSKTAENQQKTPRSFIDSSHFLAKTLKTLRKPAKPKENSLKLQITPFFP